MATTTRSTAMGSTDAVRLMAEKLGKDEQASGLLCPYCNGGNSGEKSFSIFRSATKASFICHRAQCKVQGGVLMSVLAGPDTATPAVSKLWSYKGELLALPDDVREQVINEWGLTTDSIAKMQLKWAPTYREGRIAIPIFNRGHRISGFTFRSLDKKATPKSIIQMTQTDEPVMSWYRFVHHMNMECWMLTEPLVLVEDQASAMRASMFCNAVALLGTNLGADKIGELRKAGAPSILVALDQDATDKAADIVKKLSGVFDNIELRMLKKDLKNSTDDEIKEALKL